MAMKQQPDVPGTAHFQPLPTNGICSICNFFSALFGECRSGNKHSGGAVNQSVGVSRRTKKPSELFPKQKKNRESPVSSLADKLVPQHRPLGGLDRLTDVVIAVKDTVQQPDPEGGRL